MPRLTRSQRQLLELVAAGYGLAEIAERLGIRRQSVDSGCARIRRRLGARNSIDMVGLALVDGLIDLATVRCLRRQRAFAMPRNGTSGQGAEA
ncbi:MAG TPA: helix-turn-helix transcriptional regulator [Allosphingosinicella sp.]|nr:helix-turn-helix transcriptional regulator [Allosphingosinicella sp.]